MQSMYWLCCLVGGTFVTLSALGGLDGVEFDVEGDTDFELSTPQPLPSSHSARSRSSATLTPARPLGRSAGLRFGISVLTSLRFWTFGSCFFGLTGLLLSWLQPELGAGLIFAIALGMGLLLGTAIASILVALHYRQVDSLVRATDLAGLMGTVELPFDAESKGKVRVNVRGTLVDFVARTDETTGEFVRGDRVLIVGTEHNRLWVVSADS